MSVYLYTACMTSLLLQSHSLRGNWTKIHQVKRKAYSIVLLSWHRSGHNWPWCLCRDATATKRTEMKCEMPLILKIHPRGEFKIKKRCRFLASSLFTAVCKVAVALHRHYRSVYMVVARKYNVLVHWELVTSFHVGGFVFVQELFRNFCWHFCAQHLRSFSCLCSYFKDWPRKVLVLSLNTFDKEWQINRG